VVAQARQRAAAEEVSHQWRDPEELRGASIK
jgi:hypothetical protein